MEIGKKLKNARVQSGMTQENVAEKINVSRQTISNWENDKCYPDVKSLILLGEIFHVSLDKLIKGDVDIMKEVIKKEEVEKMNRYGVIYTVALGITVVSAVPLFIWLGMWAFIPWGIIYAVALYWGIKVEKVKKNNDVKTYKEIVAFSEGKLLDDIQKQREIGKRPYQKVLIVGASAVITFVICILIGLIMNAWEN